MDGFVFHLWIISRILHVSTPLFLSSEREEHISEIYSQQVAGETEREGEGNHQKSSIDLCYITLLTHLLYAVPLHPVKVAKSKELSS